MQDFEKAFTEYMSDKRCEKMDIENMEIIIEAARSAFSAGWIAAGGESYKTLVSITLLDE